ncbi:MAG: hypothetical protein HFG20_03505 [Anaerotruncus sp.]|nr:hypothetical protein [Anaerotruncus sp.]
MNQVMKTSAEPTFRSRFENQNVNIGQKQPDTLREKLAGTQKTFRQLMEERAAEEAKRKGETLPTTQDRFLQWYLQNAQEFQKQQKLSAVEDLYWQLRLGNSSDLSGSMGLIGSIGFISPNSIAGLMRFL